MLECLAVTTESPGPSAVENEGGVPGGVSPGDILSRLTVLGGGEPGGVPGDVPGGEPGGVPCGVPAGSCVPDDADTEYGAGGGGGAGE